MCCHVCTRKSEKSINFGIKIQFFGSKHDEKCLDMSTKKEVALKTNCVYKNGFVCLETWSDFAQMCENRVWTLNMSGHLPSKVMPPGI